MAWVRAARRQSRTHSLAEDWMTPPPRLPGDRLRNFSGRPEHHQTYVLDWRRTLSSLYFQSWRWSLLSLVEVGGCPTPPHIIFTPTTTKYICTATVSVPSSELDGTPTPSPASECVLPGTTRGGTHSPAGQGVGGGPREKAQHSVYSVPMTHQTVGYSDFHNFMRFTSKKMLNNILKIVC